MATIYDSIFTFFDNASVTYINNGVVKVSDAIKDPAFTLLGCYILLWGLSHILGLIREPIVDATKRFIKVGFIFGIAFSAATYNSYIVETGTMVIHPVRMNGMFIGVPQTYEYFKKIQQRINHFVITHSKIKEERFMELMTETEVLTKDVGSILVGKQAVDEGIINEIGGLKDAIGKLYQLISEKDKNV